MVSYSLDKPLVIHFKSLLHPAKQIKLGETYEFTIQLPEPTKLALTQNNEFPFNKVVQGTRKLVFTPFLPGEVSSIWVLLYS